MDPDEVHMMRYCCEVLSCASDVGGKLEREVDDKHRRAQGDCLRPVVFILYLAKAFSYQPELNDHSYHLKSPKPPLPTRTHLIDQAYSKSINTVRI